MEHHPGAFATHPFAEPRSAPITLGTGYEFGKSTQSNEINPALALVLVADMIRANPEVAHSLARQVGYDKFIEPIDVVKPFPEHFHYTELSVSDKGAPKKGTKPSRAPARFKATLKFALVARRRVRDIWSARFDLYDAARWLKKIDELAKPSKCRTPFTGENGQWAREIAEVAGMSGHLIGFAYMQPRAEGGTHYVPCHALLVAPDMSEAFLLAKRDGAILKVALPPFSDSYADGRVLSSPFIAQSRGAIRTRDLQPVHTGYVDVLR